MRHISAFGLTAFLLFTALFSHAQELRTVEGKVVDTAQAAVARASVALFYETPGDTLRMLTNTQGEFRFTQVKNRPFTVRVSFTGFIEVEKKVTDANTLKINVGSLPLLPSYMNMQEIVITTPPVLIKEDTVEFKADSFKTKPNALVEDLLKKLPGVAVDKDGNVTAQGKQVTRVKVNGKDFFSGNVQTATRELSADMIDKVQVIDDYGDQSNFTGIRDGEPEKVLNLQLKKDKNKGMFGRITAGGGTQDRYQINGNVNLFQNNTQFSLFGNSNNINASLFNRDGGGGGGFSGGGGRGFAVAVGGGGGGNAGGQDGISTTQSLGANFRHDFEKSKGSSVYGSYTLTDRVTDGLRDVNQQNLATATKFIDNRNTVFQNSSKTHRLNLNLEYNIDSFNYIKIIPQFSYSESDNRNAVVFDQFNDKGIRSQLGNSGDTTGSRSPDLNLNVLYNHKFQKRGRNLSINTNLSSSRNQNDRNSFNYTEFFLPFVRTQITDQVRGQDNKSSSINTRVVYTEPIVKDRYMDLSYSFRNNYVLNDGETFDLRTGVPVFVPNLSNAFENDFTEQRIGASIRTVKKKYNYTLGATALPVVLKGYSLTKDSAYQPQRRVNMLPIARFQYNFTRTKGLNFNYQGNVQNPSFTQLQPILDNSNPQNQSVGNPNLKPAVQHSMNGTFNNFNFSSGRTLFLGINGSLIQNQITNNVIWLGNTGARLTRPENVNGFYRMTGFYNWSKPFQNRTYVFSLNGAVNYTNDVALVDSARNIGKDLVFSQGFNFEYNLKEWFEFDMGARYSNQTTRYSLRPEQNYNFGSWVLTSNSRADLPGGIIFRYDLQHVINIGLASGVNGNVTLLNGSLEKTVFKKKNGFIRLSGFDILNQNKNISRTVSANFITDTRVNRLTRYFMLTFTYRLNRFGGQNTTGSQTQGSEIRMRSF